MLRLKIKLISSLPALMAIWSLICLILGDFLGLTTLTQVMFMVGGFVIIVWIVEDITNPAKLKRRRR